MPRSIVYSYSFVLLFLVSVCAVPRSAYSTDYRQKEKQAITSKKTEDSRVVRLALALGRATQAIPLSRIDALAETLDSQGAWAVPAALSNSWQKLLRMAQLLVKLQSNGWFFSTGYEFETSHASVFAYEDFAKGARALSVLVQETFGHQNTVMFEEKARIRDGRNRRWNVVTEYVRETDDGKGGWELVSPPFRSPEELEKLAAFRWRLGQSKFGRSNKMTGLHQTYELLPQGVKGDSKLIARVAANMMLLQAQFSPALFDIFDVRRFGGPLNLFLRPLVFDHFELLQELSHSNPETFNLKSFRDLLFDKYLDHEFKTQVRSYYSAWGDYDESNPEIRELLEYNKYQRQTFRNIWKFRDGQVKFNLKHPEQTLYEVRIGDYVASSPEKTINQTALLQYLLKTAYNLAVNGEFFKIEIPKRNEGESEADFWKRFSVSSLSSRERLLEVIGISDEPDLALLFLSKGFTAFDPKMRAHARETFSYEIEGWEESLVRVIIPTDPKLRSRWDRLSEQGRVRFMRELGFDFEEGFSQKKRRRLVTEFAVDTDKFPELTSELHLETSGNWEIKTHSRGFSSLIELAESARKMRRLLGHGGFHIHYFIPQEQVEDVVDRRKKFVDLLERMSFFMQLKGYAEADPSDAYHGLDSWSLDRFSPQDLIAIERHLDGRLSLNSSEQKYHNIGFRPVEGGLDIEMRDVGDDVDYGVNLLSRLIRAVRNEELGGAGNSHRDVPLFSEFRDYESTKGLERFTLSGAVAERYDISQSTRELLRKFQFEIYKPSMGDYIHFAGFSGVDETDPKDMDVKFVRTNFENNVAIPLLNYSEQRIFSQDDLKAIEEAKERFVKKVRDLALRVEEDARYDFVRDSDSFLHLAEYLKKSTHASRPNFRLVVGKKAEKQRVLLEGLVYELRGYVVEFVKSTKLDLRVESTLPQGFSKKLTSNKPVGPVGACDGILR